MPHKILNLILVKTTLICKIKNVQGKQHYNFALLKELPSMSFNLSKNTYGKELSPLIENISEILISRIYRKHY